MLGRAKTSIKLGNGKWVQPEKLEDLYRQASLVRYVLIHGTSHTDNLVAVVDAETDDTQAVLTELAKLAELHQLHSHEVISAVVLSEGHFSQDTGELNGTGKLHRRNVVKRYAHDLEDAFLEAEKNAAVSAPQSHLVMVFCRRQLCSIWTPTAVLKHRVGHHCRPLRLLTYT